MYPRRALHLPPTQLAVETEAYQVLLEGHRRYPDDDDIYHDMLKARTAMEVAWLEMHARKQL
jgi:hypothetical protein